LQGATTVETKKTKVKEDFECAYFPSVLRNVYLFLPQASPKEDENQYFDDITTIIPVSFDARTNK